MIRVRVKHLDLRDFSMSFVLLLHLNLLSDFVSFRQFVDAITISKDYKNNMNLARVNHKELKEFMCQLWISNHAQVLVKALLEKFSHGWVKYIEILNFYLF